MPADGEGRISGRWIFLEFLASRESRTSMQLGLPAVPRMGHEWRRSGCATRTSPWSFCRRYFFTPGVQKQGVELRAGRPVQFDGRLLRAQCNERSGTPSSTPGPKSETGSSSFPRRDSGATKVADARTSSRGLETVSSDSRRRPFPGRREAVVSVGLRRGAHDHDWHHRPEECAFSEAQ